MAAETLILFAKPPLAGRVKDAARRKSGARGSRATLRVFPARTQPRRRKPSYRQGRASAIVLRVGIGGG